MKSNKKIKNKKFLIIIIILIIYVVLLFYNQYKSNQYSFEEYTSSSDLKNIKEIIEYFGSTYIEEVDNKNAEFEKEIYVKFKYNTFENKKSQEEYYRKIINCIVNFMEYKNFKIIDEEKQIVIEIKCTNEDEDKHIDSISINGNYDYFNYMKSLIDKKEMEAVDEVVIEKYSEIIQNAIDNDWIYRNINFGTQESKFNKYDIYFDEGIEVRVIDRKVFNIIINEKYKDTIINNISIETSLEQIEDILGNPSFEEYDNEKKIIGYKTNDIYIFFRENEISIYPLEKETTYEKFNELLEEFETSKDLEDFTNKLTYLWPDYDFFEYDTSNIELRYALRGIRIGYNIEDGKNGVILYNNSTNKIEKDTILYENEDLVFKTELERISKQKELYELEDINEDIELDNSEEMFENVITNQNSSNEFDFKYYNKNMCFMSKTGKYPNSEFTINSTVNTYFWINDNLFLYSLDYQGIYVYNAITMKKEKIISVEDIIEIKSYENNILKYNDTEIEIKL